MTAGAGGARRGGGTRGRTLPPTSLRSLPQPAEPPVWVWGGTSGGRKGAAWAPHPRRGARLGTCGRARFAGRPGRGGCERAPPPCPLRSARLAGEAPPRAPGSPQPQSCRPRSFVRRRRRRLRVPPAGGGETRKGKKKRRRGERRRPEPTPPPGAHLPGAPQSRRPACTRPPPPARPGLASSPRQPQRQPLQPGPRGPAAATWSRRRV